jgi:hypothetical protein
MVDRGDVDSMHDAATEQPSLEEVQLMMDGRAPAGMHVKDARWLAYYRVNNRSARHYRHGRTFVAGDAVHINSPFAGLGMNTAFRMRTIWRGSWLSFIAATLPSGCWTATSENGARSGKTLSSSP